MLQLELPHVNVLSKIDLLSKFGKLGISFQRSASNLPDFNLQAYVDVGHLSELQYALGQVYSNLSCLIS